MINDKLNLSALRASLLREEAKTNFSEKIKSAGKEFLYYKTMSRRQHYKTKNRAETTQLGYNFYSARRGGILFPRAEKESKTR